MEKAGRKRVHSGLATILSRSKNGRRNKNKSAFFPSPVFSARETCSKSRFADN